MTVYLITYDLNSPGQDYNKLYDEIKSLGETDHSMESIWFVDTNLTANGMRDRLKSKLDSNDKLFITQVTSNYAGWAPESLWNWLSSHVK